MAISIVMVEFEGGDLLRPMTANYPDAETVVAKVSKIFPNAKAVTIKGRPDDKMEEWFGDQPEGTIVMRDNWRWDGDNAVPEND